MATLTITVEVTDTEQAIMLNDLLSINDCPDTSAAFSAYIFVFAKRCNNNKTGKPLNVDGPGNLLLSGNS